MSETEPTGSLFDDFPAVDPEEWGAKVQSEVGRSPDDFLTWSSPEGVTMPAYLHRDALEEVPHVDRKATVPPLADAADAPANEWILCHPIHHPNPETVNEHARAAVEGGARDLELIVSPAGSEIRGLTVGSVETLATILEGIDLRTTGLHLGRGLAAPALYGLLREHLTALDIDPTSVRGSVAYDPVAVLASGPCPSVDRAFALADQLVVDADERPRLRSVTVDARVYHDAGASVVQELTYTLGALTERLARSTERGLPLPTLLDDVQIIVPVSTSYFAEIAKLRALRLLVPQVIGSFLSSAEADLSFSPSDLHLRAETSRRTETIYDPHVNMLRATTEAMAAVLGGCDMLTVRPYDASLRPPDTFGVRIARNTQLVLRHEAHLDQVADPAAGAYYLETLTDRLAQRAWDQFQALEADGGIVEGLQDGSVQRRIADTRRERLEAIDEREQVLVGTTHYPALDERRRNDLVSPKASTPNGESEHALDASSLDEIRSAVRDGAPLPEIIAVLRTSESPIDPLPRIRVADEVESIRLRTEAYAESHDGPPQVLLAPLGPPAARSARATFARNFLGVAGFAIEEPLKFESVDAAADAAAEEDVDIVVLCSSNAEYPDRAPALASALADRDHDALLLIAGSPDDIDLGDAADFFVHQGSPLKKTLTTLQERLGIPTENAT